VDGGWPAAAAAAAITAGPIGAERDPEEDDPVGFSLFFLRKNMDERSFFLRRFPRESSSSKLGLARKKVWRSKKANTKLREGKTLTRLEGTRRGTAVASLGGLQVVDVAPERHRRRQ